MLALLVAATACGPLGGGRKTAVSTPAPPRPAFLAPPVINLEFDPNQSHPFVEQYILRATYTPETDALLQEVEDRFRAGEAFYRQGDLVNARRQFDTSIEMLLKAPEDAYDRHRVKAKCDELAEAIYHYDVDGLGASEREPGFEPSPLDDVLAATFPVDPNIELNVVEQLKLPVSELPLEVNGEVMRYINYFSSARGRKTLEEGLRRIGRYRPMILRVFQEEGVPQELIYLGMAESGFKARARSRKRATGMWQFMSYSGREYGLGRTRYYDDRLDPEKATRAAARHLRDLYERLGDWYLAMAAYNGGPSRIDRAVRRTGYADFWEFSRRRVLPRETRNYVPIILAYIIMAKNPSEYGLEDLVPDPPLEYSTIDISVDTHLGLVADVLGKPLDEIRELNPAILRDVVPAGYVLHVPKGTGGFVMSALRTVPAGRRAEWRVHRVGYGETFAQIATMYRTTPEKIAVANGGALSKPVEGDLVVVPVSYNPSKERSRKPARGLRSGG